MEEVTQKAELGRLVPAFRLPNMRGELISNWDYKEKKNLVIVFFDPTSSNDLALLALLRRRQDEFQEDETEIIGISRAGVDELSVCATELRLPFTLLSDESGETACAYGAEKTSVYVADRFGELRMRADVEDDSDRLIDSILDSLGLVEIQCDECGVPSWM